MRFFEDGPSIPPFLIEQRSLGNVIVFCGAGISRRAGLPDFGGLTEKLIKKLGAEKAAKALAANESFDRVFNALVSEFGSQEIDKRIYEALKTPRKPDLENHRIVLDLSRNLSGVPQIVTTNFDLLFERVDRGIKRFVPPSLPDLSLGTPLQGVVYLHGRLAKPDGQAKAGYVISSADFGRAYLAQGWAARFVKALRERYTIVLLGYSANDPPMRYLLEGLHSEDGVGYRPPIYTFAPGNLDDMEEEWRDRGVTPIAYDPIDKGHSGLWDSLRAWTSASIEPGKWEAKVLSLAKQRPSVLKPYQRGQVAQLISTKAGAKLFADMEPPPPAEWLCVFDQNARYAKPRAKSLEDDAEKIDPLSLFGLDDDPERLPEKPNEQTPVAGTNYLRWMYGDTSFPERTGLFGWNPEWSNQLPERLSHIARWFGKVADQVAAVWWAAGWISLHPGMTWFVNRRLRDTDEIAGPARKFWNLYLEAALPPLIGDHDFRWYEFKDVVKQGGWTGFALREFERAIQPKVTFRRSPYAAPRPPEDEWGDRGLRDLLEIKVRVLDQHCDNLDIPDPHLHDVVELVRRSLALTAQLLSEVETVWWQAPTLFPTGDQGETFHGKKERYFLWFASLFQRLKTVDPQLARSEMDHWNSDEPYFFGKLSLFALADPDFISSAKAATKFVALASPVFFNSYNRRELLIGLRAHWPNLSTRERRAIESKIFEGEPRREDIKVSDHRRHTATTAASLLRWLELNGCSLTLPTAARLSKLKNVDPRWNDEWARNADDSLGVRVGWVETVKDDQGLSDLPIEKIVAAAQKRTGERFGEFRHLRPFEGLVEAAPLKAISALRREAKRANYPISFWETLLSNWPENTPLRLRWLMARSVTELPQAVARDLRHYIPSWLRTHISALATANRRAALAVLDAAIAQYDQAPPEVTESGVGTTTVGGVVVDRSEVSFEKAINSPVGKLTESLFLLHPKGSRSRPFPKFLAERLQRLFRVSGNGGGHAVCIATQRMGWLDFYYRPWVQATLVPFFSLDCPLSEAAWHGRAFDQNGLSSETWKMILPSLLELLSGRANWKLNERDFRRHVRALVWLSRREGDEPPLISQENARSVLLAIDDKARAEIINALVHLAAKEGEWRRFIKPFIEQVWPRQLRYRSEETSRAFARLVEGLGADFPDAVETVLPFLRAVPHVDMITYRLSKEVNPDEQDFARTYPAATLSLLNALIAEDRSSMPYELPKVLEIIAEADPSLRQTTAWRRLQDLAT